jgi:hypothetical protein
MPDDLDVRLGELPPVPAATVEKLDRAYRKAVARCASVYEYMWRMATGKEDPKHHLAARAFLQAFDPRLAAAVGARGAGAEKSTRRVAEKDLEGVPTSAIARALAGAGVDVSKLAELSVDGDEEAPPRNGAPGGPGAALQDRITSPPAPPSA